MSERARKDSNNVRRARLIARSLGCRVAARYLARRGWSFEGAHYVILGYFPRKVG